MPARPCKHEKPDGTRCGSPAVTGKRFCVVHDPASRRKMADARRRGGENRKPPPATLPEDTPPLRLRTIDDVVGLLEEAANSARVGRMSVNVANCLGQLGQVLLKALEKSDLEQRIEALEARRGTR